MKLNPRERRLAVIFVTIIFLIVNLLILPNLHSGIHQKRKDVHDLIAQRMAAESWLQQRDFWEERASWIRGHQPAQDDRGEVSAAQLEALQQAASRHGLTLGQVVLLPTESGVYFDSVGVRIPVRGPWPGMVRFLAEVQSPTGFRAIPRFTVASDAEPTHVVAELEVQQWLQRPTAP